MYRKNAWEKYDENELKNVEELVSGYKAFISKGKTEREAVKLSLTLLKEHGFKEYEEGMNLKAGDKVYFINRGKNVCAYVIGKEKVSKGIRILGAHIDSPRLDLKQNPLYEDSGFVLLDTHYYGGVKKYQWVTIPLALYGVVYTKDGNKVDISIGDDPNDPIVGISDLLIHLSGDQLTQPAHKVIPGESLDVTVGNRPLKGAEKDKVKSYILGLLKEKYGIEEEDFVSSEIEVVPAGPARDYGLDRSMIAGYGHDDRSCAYTSLRAILDLNGTPEFTACTILVDKEEIGSVGATGAQSKFFGNTIHDVLEATGEATNKAFRNCLDNSKMLSSDVSAGFDPLFKGVNEAKNSCYLGEGIVFNKYTGRAGKGGCNDANPDYIAWLRKILDDENVNFQTAELGKVDQGGGGTIAYILGNMNMNVIDAGIAVLNMHAPMEIVSKADVYEAYRAYKVFLEAK